jgi:predicted ribonuclease YlaK
MTAFYDTSSLLLAQDKAFEEHFYISSVTLSELEHIKVSEHKSTELKYKARKLVRLLDEHRDAFTSVVDDTAVRTIVDKHFLPDSADNRILASMSLTSCDVCYSDDLCMRLVGQQVFGLNMQSYDEKESSIYTGYQLFSGDEDDFIVYMSNLDKSKWVINEYLVFNNTATGQSSEMRFDGSEFVPLKLPPSSFIKAKTPLQRCALDMLMNDNVTVCAILGSYGSGKTYLATQMAFYNVTKRNKQSKVLGVREAKGEGQSVGFLPGDFSSKVGFFFAPLAQSISGGQYMLDDYMRRGVLETNIPFYMKGTTYHDTIMVVDEAEDLSESQIRLIGTRIGDNGRIFLSGDYGQSLLDKTVHNPLVRMCNELRGDKKFACIYLGEDVRSDTSKMFTHLFKQ